MIEHPLSSEARFTNREIGWLNFNKRVLFQAEDSQVPLLERLKFLAICNSNLDEFFMKRVGGLKRQVAFGISAKSSDGKNPQQQIQMIRTEMIAMIAAQAKCFKNLQMNLLPKAEIYLKKWSDLNPNEKEFAQKYYARNVYPVLTPLSVDPGHPFPFISNLSTSLGVIVKNPDREERLFARVKVPQVLPQWVRLEVEPQRSFIFVSLVDLIQENIKDLFPNMQVLSVMPFRLTRNADISRDEEDAEDLLAQIEEELKLRRFAEVVRLEHGPKPDPWVLQFLMEELDLKPDDIFELPSLLDFRGLTVISDLKIPELRDSPFTPTVPKELQEEDPNLFFSQLRSRDHLLHHPFESFSSVVEKFIRFAADDPKVLAIKMTLYRTGDNSPFIQSLIRAAADGKQVVCLVELKARFDEERNIYWAQELENAGVHVVYGIVGLKTHAKTALVVRQEAEGLVCYSHIGTGNYNTSTSRMYTDFGLLTANEAITKELVEFFHYLTGRSLKSDYSQLLVAPINMFHKFKWMIIREIENAKAGKPAGIFAKMNNMEENDIAMELYRASSQGVEVDLAVRGFCCLRPGLPGLSDKIKVFSTLGRFLEHSRIFYFRNGAQNPVHGEFYMGSADWMYRNLHARVECVVPILDPLLKEKCWEILQAYKKDQRQTWDMDSAGNYHLRKGAATVGVHSMFMTQAVTIGEREV